MPSDLIEKGLKIPKWYSESA